ncbi:TIGR04076 family protein (plasmid) [Aggregatilineales bacterium SYSU G02658]
MWKKAGRAGRVSTGVRLVGGAPRVWYAWRSEEYHPMDFDLYDLRVTVEAIEGRSVCGLQVGDYFELTDSSRLRIPPDKHFCLYALSSVLPLLAAKQRQLHPNDWLERDALIACPDPEERLIMRVERVAKKTLNSDELT